MSATLVPDLMIHVAGTRPVLVNVPHAGTRLSPGLADRLTPEAQQLPDTDWFVDELAAFVTRLGASLCVARYSRYVVDLNRPGDNSALYPRAGTGLVPNTDFDGKPLYLEGEVPDDAERRDRVRRYWKPYHRHLQAELTAMRNRHGHAIVLDLHSIRSEVPLLFDGRLPDLNLGTWEGRSAAPGLAAAAWGALSNDQGLTRVWDGRFKGGHITRAYGQPINGIHALQLETAQSSYMQEDPPKRSEEGMAVMQGIISQIVHALMSWRPLP